VRIRRKSKGSIREREKGTPVDCPVTVQVHRTDIHAHCRCSLADLDHLNTIVGGKIVLPEEGEKIFHALSHPNIFVGKKTSSIRDFDRE
jgi:hypothetical protein